MSMLVLDVEQSVINWFYAHGKYPLSALHTESGGDVPDIQYNEPVILKGPQSSALAIRSDVPESGVLVRLNEASAFGLKPRNAEQIAALHLVMDPHVPLVSLVGKAGSGKTLLAIAAAMEMQQKQKRFSKVLIARALVSMDDSDDLGFIPGSLDDKLAPWMAPIVDNLAVLDIDKSRYMRLIEQNHFELCPLPYIRGRSLSKVCVIIDEAQNLSPTSIKTIVTRIGEGTKMILTGDTDQVDRARYRNGEDGLSNLIKKTLNKSPLIGNIKLRQSERSPVCELLTELL